MRPAQSLVDDVAGHAFGSQIDQHHMGVGAVGHRVQPAFDQLIRQRLRVGDNLLDVGP